MIKLMFPIRRRADLTPEQFREHYEGNHVPLVMSHLGAFISDYVRNYVDHDSAFGVAGLEATEVGFDVVTEMWFADDDVYRAFLERSGRDDVSAAIAADEARFIDRESVVLFRVHEAGGAAVV